MMLTFSVVVPAAGVGRRMGAGCPKQYLPLAGRFLIEHTLTRLLEHPRIDEVIVALAPEDTFFSTLTIADHPRLRVAQGGANGFQDHLAASVSRRLIRPGHQRRFQRERRARTFRRLYVVRPPGAP